MSKQRDYDSTVARIAGNILSGHVPGNMNKEQHFIDTAYYAVKLARAIVAEVKRTEPTKVVHHGYGCPHDGDLLTNPRPDDCRCDDNGDTPEVREQVRGR